TGTLLVLDTKTDSGDPTGVNGGMYYNSDAGEFRFYENGAWRGLGSAGSGGDILQGGNSFTDEMTLGTNDDYDLRFETNGTTRFIVDNGSALMTGQGNTVLLATGTMNLRADADSNLSIGSNALTGNISIGGASQSGTINIGNSGSSTGAIN